MHNYFCKYVFQERKTRSSHGVEDTWEWGQQQVSLGVSVVIWCPPLPLPPSLPRPRTTSPINLPKCWSSAQDRCWFEQNVMSAECRWDQRRQQRDSRCKIPRFADERCHRCQCASSRSAQSQIAIISLSSPPPAPPSSRSNHWWLSWMSLGTRLDAIFGNYTLCNTRSHWYILRAWNISQSWKGTSSGSPWPKAPLYRP